MKLFALALVVSLLFLSCATVSRFRPEAPYGKTVRWITLDCDRLKTKVGNPLRKEDVQADLNTFWKEFGLRAETHYTLVKKGVNVIFRLEPIAQATKHSDKQFVWGAGVSSGAGVRGTFQFNKRNFRQETVDLKHIDANAPTIVWGSEGNIEMRVRPTGQRR